MFNHRISCTIIIFVLGFSSALLMTGCGFREPKWRTYEEVNAKKSSAMRPTVPGPSIRPEATVNANDLRWTAPKGWTEEAGSGMRLATFTVMRSNQTATFTFVTLSGAAGGLEANVRRWIGQLKKDNPPADELNAFLGRQPHVHSKGGFEGVVVDLTSLGPSSDGSSMLAALFSVGSSTLFVKMTGPIDLLVDEKERFSALCESLRTDS